MNLFYDFHIDNCSSKMISPFKKVNSTYDIILEFNPGLLCYLCPFYIYELAHHFSLTSITSLNNSTK